MRYIVVFLLSFIVSTSYGQQLHPKLTNTVSDGYIVIDTNKITNYLKEYYNPNCTATAYNVFTTRDKIAVLDSGVVITAFSDLIQIKYKEFYITYNRLESNVNWGQIIKKGDLLGYAHCNDTGKLYRVDINVANGLRECRGIEVFNILCR